MLRVVASLAGLIKIRSSQTLVDDAVFRLHYRWTTSLCFVACGLVAASDLVGEPIQCMIGIEEAPKPITTYCWISSTFTINTTVADGEEGPYEALGSKYYGLGNHKAEGVEIRVHAYYQWVPAMLFGMGCLFYLPHLIWKEVEGRKLQSLLQGLTVISMDETTPAKKNNIVRYLYDSHGLLNGLYAYGYFAMQVLNLIMVMAVMMLLQSFFGGIFMEYGSQVIQHLNGHPDVEHNPMIVAFPRIAKCIFRKFGPGGGIVEEDVLCLLPQNIMNEKIFLLLWFWLILLTTVTAVQIVYLAVLFVSPYLRLKAIEQQGKMIPSSLLEGLIHQLHLGDFFLLMNISKNLDAIAFKDILQEFIKKMSANSATGVETVAPGSMFSPHAPSYRHFNVDDEDPVEYKRRMEISNTSV